MTTHGETLSTITTPTKAVTAAPRLRELTYRYQPKHAPDGQPIRLGWARSSAIRRRAQPRLRRFCTTRLLRCSGFCV